MTSIDNYYFYYGCVSAIDAYSTGIITLMGIYLSSLLFLIIFLSTRMHGVPERFNTSSTIVMTSYFLIGSLLVLVINQSIVYSEFVKVAVFCVVYFVSLLIVNISMIIIPLYRAAVESITSSNNSNSDHSSGNSSYALILRGA